MDTHGLREELQRRTGFHRRALLIACAQCDQQHRGLPQTYWVGGVNCSLLDYD